LQLGSRTKGPRGQNLGYFRKEKTESYELPGALQSSSSVERRMEINLDDNTFGPLVPSEDGFGREHLQSRHEHSDSLYRNPYFSSEG